MPCKKDLNRVNSVYLVSISVIKFNDRRKLGRWDRFNIDKKEKVF